MNHSICCILPTIGRESLHKALNSVFNNNYRAGDQCILVCDGCKVPFVPPHVVVIERTEQGKDYGNKARNEAKAHVKTDLVIYMDDDDEYIAGSWNGIRNCSLDALTIAKMRCTYLGRALDYKCIFPDKTTLIEACAEREKGPRCPYVLDFEYTIPIGEYECLGHDERALFGYLALSEGFATVSNAKTGKILRLSSTSAFKSGKISVLGKLLPGKYYVSGHIGLMYTPFGFLYLQLGLGDVIEFYRKPKVIDQQSIDAGAKILWRMPELVLGNISTQMLVVPATSTTLWQGIHYTSDFDYARRVKAEYGKLEWNETILCLKSPANRGVK